ncbi:MAG: FKBP-type peptidyl-prolyl cis-trans isomerase SlyD [Burkholderiaceae bacterium]|jgi:FKBP-type peptidyl-prolyl cis-trans isomerase SlyD|nr:MAG: FKBP-type peptidyl-prolyl cis-trans isomerase SlyD [Burkholderiaceae bacterium]
MEINRQCVVGLTWKLEDTLGETLDVLAEPVEFLVGGSDLLDAIDDALQGHAAGDRLDLHLEPEQAFGDYDDQLILLEPREAFPAELEEGMSFAGAALPSGTPTGAPQDAIYTVTDIYPDHVVLDGNHPLAGIALRLHLKIVSVRAATDEELAHGSCGAAFFRVAPGAAKPD